MEFQQPISTANDLRFLVSLLRIANPGEPVSPQTQSLEELLATKANR